MYKAIILPPAKQDTKSAAQWYNKQEKGLGKNFTKQVREKIKFIKQSPKTIAVRYDETRTAIVSGFPYMIHFDIDQPKKLIIVSAIFHTSRDPERWYQRKK